MNYSKINIDNYEAFLLDKIEGNLSQELEFELDLFLKNNDLEDVSGDDLVYLDENDLQNPIANLCLLSEDLKHYQPSMVEEKLIFEAVEGNIEEEVEKKFKTWIASDIILNQHFQAMLATRSAVEKDLLYPHKSQLKKREPIVKYLYYLAAACFLGVMVLFGYNQLNTVDEDQSFTQAIERTNKGQENKRTETGLKPDDIVNVPSENVSLTINPQIGEVIRIEDKSSEKHDLLQLTNNNSTTPFNDKLRTGKNKDVVAVNHNVPVPSPDEVPSERGLVKTLPKIVRLGTDKVVSSIPKSAIINTYQSKRMEEEPLMASALSSIKDKIDYLDRKSAAIYGFADYQKNIIKSEGLLEVSKERNADGKVEGYSLRIAGFELSTAR